jgi:hypothetical protein
MVASVSEYALIDDCVLDTEDPDTLDLEQALRWVQTYAQLLALSVMVQAEHRGQIDGLARQAEMYSRRLAFWKERSKAIADRFP